MTKARYGVVLLTILILLGILGNVVGAKSLGEMHFVSIEQQYRAVLEEQRIRVVEARRRVEEKHKNCNVCQGKGIAMVGESCNHCQGTGKVVEKQGTAKIVWDCPKCHKKGMVFKPQSCSKCRPYDLRKENMGTNKDKFKGSNPQGDFQKCPRCQGKKYVLKEESCRSCKGKGEIIIPAKKVYSQMSLTRTQWTRERKSKCTVCGGSGRKTVREKCGGCGGKGNVSTEVRKDQNDSKSMSDVFKWFMYTAEQGRAKAQYCLGIMYATGDGIEKNSNMAVKWFTKAAEQGLADAQFLLGECYATGIGIPKNSSEAINWINKAEASGYDKNQCRIGCALAQRKDMPIDDYNKTKGSITRDESSIQSGTNSGDGVIRKHSFRCVTAMFGGTQFQIRALDDGTYNYIISENLYEYGSMPLNSHPMSHLNRKLRCVKMVVFNGVEHAVTEAFREAIHKAREWIMIGRKRHTTTSELLDMVRQVKRDSNLRNERSSH